MDGLSLRGCPASLQTAPPFLSEVAQIPCEQHLFLSVPTSLTEAEMKFLSFDALKRAVLSRVRKAAVRWLRRCPDLGLDYIDFVGPGKIRDPSLSKLRRLAWVMWLLVSTVLTLYYLSNQVKMFWAKPVGVAFSAEENSTTKLPAVTVCVKQKFDFQNLLELWEERGPGGRMPVDAEKILMGYANISQSDIWRRGGYELNKLIVKCMLGPGATCDEKGRWSPVFTSYGQCFTYSGGVIHMDGPLYGLYLQLRNRNHPYGDSKPYGVLFSGYQIAIHNIQSPPSLVINDGFQCSVMGGKRACDVMVSVRIRGIGLMNRPGQLCEEDPNYNEYSCRAKCMYTELVQQLGCRLPYMEVPGQECSGRAVVDNAEKVVFNQASMGDFNLSKCLCPVSCSYVLHQQHSDSSWSHDNTARIKIYLSSSSKDTLNEMYSYTPVELWGDIGGIAGLLLGGSVLTVIQGLEVLFFWGCKLAARLLAK